MQIGAHSPLSSPSITEYGAAVPPNSEVFIEVEPEVTVVENEKTLRGIDLVSHDMPIISQPFCY